MPVNNPNKSIVLQGVVHPTNEFPLNVNGNPIPATGGKAVIIRGTRPTKVNINSSASLSTGDALGIFEVSVKLINSKKYPTPTNREDRRDQVINGDRPEYGYDIINPDFDTLGVAAKIASNPTPLSIATAIFSEILDFDIMGRVEKQLRNLEDIQMWEEENNKKISSAMQAGIASNQARLESEMKVLANGLEQQMESKIRVLTGRNVEIPRMQKDITGNKAVKDKTNINNTKKLSNTEKLKKVLENISNFVSNGNIKFKGFYMGVRVFETRFCENGNAITLPPLGIFVSPNRSEKELADTLRHEHGHILQSYLLGIVGFYTFIGVPSMVSAIKANNNPNYVHQKFYTENAANQLEYWLLGKPKDWSDEYPLYFK